MVQNIRALKLKANAEEFDSKKDDLKRLRGALEKFATEALGSPVRQVIPIFKVVAPYRGFQLKVEVGFDFVKSKVIINLIAADRLIEHESQLHLEIVRLAHDNMDIILEAVEEFCQKAGRSEELRMQFQRFLV